MIVALIRALSRSIATAIRNDPEVRRMIAAHPRGWKFIAGRFDPAAPYGLRLTFGAAVSLAFLVLFLGVVEDLLSKDPLVEADLRIISLVQMFRAEPFDSVMLFFTYLGNWQVVALGLLLLATWLAFYRRWRWLAATFVSISLGEAFVWVFKTVFQRSRPDLANALVPAHGASFPSGHTFVAFAFYGLAAWFLIVSVRSRLARVLIAAVALAGALTIGFSRIYLGVHWPSDVLASYVLGSSWLTITITFLSILDSGTAGRISYGRGAAGRALAVGLVLIWAAGVATFYETHPLQRRTPTEPATVDIAEGNLPQGLFAAAPRFSEDIIGRPMEPVNVILVGSENDVAKAFAGAGWQPTDRITLANSWQLLVAELFNRPDPTAPGAPSFWRGNPNRWGFERPTQSNSARERRHIHVWNTPFRVGVIPVWIGTVHRDVSPKTSFGFSLPVHSIDPAVDRERANLLSEFEKGSCVRQIRQAAVNEPMMGQSAAGSGFFTDGMALIVNLACN